MSTTPPLGIASGSGLDLTGLLDEVAYEQPFHTVPGLAHGHVPGHAYTFVHGRCGAWPVVLQRGRLHLYEGVPYQRVVQTIDALRGLGVRTVLFTNVAGGLQPEVAPGDLVAVQRFKLWPCAAWPDQPAEIPTDFVVSQCERVGFYYWMHGPCYETPAEIAALQRLGGSVVGMSTAPEIARCHQLGLRAGAITCVTNSCCQPGVLTHAHVVATARRASARLTAVIRRALPELAARL